MNTDLLEELYKRYYRELYLYAYSLCGDTHKAQELCSDTFFKALISCDDDCPSIKYWLLRVCKNCYIDQWRREKHSTGPPDENIAAPDSEPLEQLIRKEEQLALYRAIMQLPIEQREILQLFYFNGLSGQQIAQLCGRTAGSVRTLLHRSRTQLKKLLKEDM